MAFTTPHIPLLYTPAGYRATGSFELKHRVFKMSLLKRCHSKCPLTLLAPRSAFAEKGYRPIQHSGTQKSDLRTRRPNLRSPEIPEKEPPDSAAYRCVTELGAASRVPRALVSLPSEEEQSQSHARPRGSRHTAAAHRRFWLGNDSRLRVKNGKKRARGEGAPEKPALSQSPSASPGLMSSAYQARPLLSVLTLTFPHQTRCARSPESEAWNVPGSSFNQWSALRSLLALLLENLLSSPFCRSLPNFMPLSQARAGPPTTKIPHAAPSSGNLNLLSVKVLPEVQVTKITELKLENKTSRSKVHPLSTFLSLSEVCDLRHNI